MKGFCPFPKSKAQTEPSAAGARRGVCNCIRTTIPLGPPAEGRPGPSDDDDNDENDFNDSDNEDYLRTELELVCPLHNRQWLGA